MISTLPILRSQEKKDDILYLVLDSPTKIKDIRRRVADCQNPEIRTRDYIPPIFFDRYSALARHAAGMRSENSELKTQIRFMDSDISLFTKIRGSEEPFEEVNMVKLVAEIKLPAIDYSVKWNMKSEHQPWRRTSPETRKIILKSLGGTEDTGASQSSRLEPARKRNKSSAEKFKTVEKTPRDRKSDSTKRKESTDMETEQ